MSQYSIRKLTRQTPRETKHGERHIVYKRATVLTMAGNPLKLGKTDGSQTTFFKCRKRKPKVYTQEKNPSGEKIR